MKIQVKSLRDNTRILNTFQQRRKMAGNFYQSGTQSISKFYHSPPLESGGFWHLKGNRTVKALLCDVGRVIKSGQVSKV